MTATPQPSARAADPQRLRRELVAEKHAQAVALLRRQHLDCWLTFSREGSDLLLPFVMGGESLVGTSALLLFADGPSVAIVADYDVGQVEGAFDDVMPYSLDWTGILQGVLRERRPERIGLNYDPDDHGVDGLTHGLYLALVETLAPLDLPASALVSAAPVAAAMRAIKTPSEVERMRLAAAVTQQIFDDLTVVVKPGLTELDVHGFLHERIQAHGVGPAWEGSYCPTVASSRSAGGHTPPGTTRLEPGDGLRVDFGVRLDGYCSDLQRTWYLRRPGETAAPAEMQRAFEAIRDAIQMAADALRPGMRGREVDAPVRQFLADRGYTFTHTLGHQLGRLAHDGGLLLGPDNARYGARSGGVVEAGMVFTLEPVVPPIGLEEDVLVTETGCEYLTPPQREIYLV